MSPSSCQSYAIRSLLILIESTAFTTRHSNVYLHHHSHTKTAGIHTITVLSGLAAELYLVYILPAISLVELFADSPIRDSQLNHRSLTFRCAGPELVRRATHV